MDAAQYALMVMFALSAVLGFWTLRLYMRNNQDAFLKMAMLGWYGYLCFMSVFNVAISYTFEVTVTSWTTVYNATGQMMALTGIIDVSQFAYCRSRLLRLRETNAIFARAYIACICVAGVAFVVMITLVNTSGASLDAYRTASIALISVETVMYLWALYTLWGNKRAAIYYSLTLCSRFGILFTIIGRFVGFLDNDLFRSIHAGFVLTAVAAIGVFDLPSGRSLCSCLRGRQGEDLARSSTEHPSTCTTSQIAETRLAFSSRRPPGTHEAIPGSEEPRGPSRMYSHSEGRGYSQSERRGLSQSERRGYSQSERRGHSQSERHSAKFGGSDVESNGVVRSNSHPAGVHVEPPVCPKTSAVANAAPL